MEKTTWENTSSHWSASRNFSFLEDKKIKGVQSNYSQKHQSRLKNLLLSTVLESNKALDEFVKTLRKDFEITCIVNKETITREIVEKLFQSVQFGPADTTNPSQLQNTVWF